MTVKPHFMYQISPASMTEANERKNAMHAYDTYGTTGYHGDKCDGLRTEGNPLARVAFEVEIRQWGRCYAGWPSW